MTWANLKGDFQALLTEALALKRESRALSPSLFNQSPLEQVATKADELFERFAEADSRLAQAGALNVGFNGQVIEASSYVIVASARESVRTMLHEIQSDIQDVRDRKNNRVNAILALVGIALAVLALFV